MGDHLWERQAVTQDADFWRRFLRALAGDRQAAQDVCPSEELGKGSGCVTLAGPFGPSGGFKCQRHVGWGRTTCPSKISVKVA